MEFRAGERVEEVTTITLADWVQSPDILVEENEHGVLTTAALTDGTQSAEEIDFLLYELDRAKVTSNALLPTDIVRLNSIVRYRSITEPQRTIKLVLPKEREENYEYRLSVTTLHGAALLGLRPGQSLSWITPDGAADQVEVLAVANTVIGR
ncbi:regulator of nucleoside diphosphate kinase [Devosia pacifica]|uniref:Regulator of nucleoside diphosphate kinase n=1 Tax=Devosia pacifica TaxID=1335967 RepID=A0A918VVI1_9HYPH|nr:regulator of nucleoside diphosphate kinase [Devosia pacifica]